MNILILGIKGFIGSNLAKFFELAGYNIKSITREAFFDKEKFVNSIENSQVVINCIGSANVEFSYTNTSEDFESNVGVVRAILEILREQNLKELKFINLSSASVYGNPKQLPVQELDPIQPLSPYFDDPRFGSWEKIMEFYKQEVVKYNFDVAILGCGSWGMPLAAHIKKMGKVAIHLGGSTQLLFGIIGTRWETQWPEFRALNLVNDHWVRPLKEETPNWAKGFDKNSYW